MGPRVNPQITIATIAVTVALFLASSIYLSFQSSISTLQAQQSQQDQKIVTLQTQLDTINTRGTTGADSRLNALEQTVAINNTRITRLENSTSQNH